MSRLVWQVWVGGSYDVCYTEEEAQEVYDEYTLEGYDDVKIVECVEFEK